MGIEQIKVSGVDMNELCVVVDQSCFRRCSRLAANILELAERATERSTDELALICEGGPILSRCPGIIVRTDEPSSTIAGPFFGERNANEGDLFRMALAQNSALTAAQASAIVQG